MRFPRFLLATTALVGLVHCVSSESEAPPPANVVLVTVDTLRADRLGVYGSRSGLTPNLDRIAKEGVVFDNASTVTPLTLPAHASILTGTYPLAHGIRDNGGYYLPRESVTLAETLRERGYATGAFVGAFVLDSRWGLDQGFERYFDDFDFGSFDDVSLGAVQRPGNVVLDEALRFMEQVQGRPFFCWIHFYDPHTPYAPPEPHRSRHAGGKWGLYDGEVAFVDELVGRLSDWLSRRSLSESTILAILGDHGESLEDHGELEHGFFIYDATMKVPFLVQGPNVEAAGRHVKSQVRTIDLMPTILDWLHVPIPASVQGVSLRPYVDGDPDPPELVAYGESYYPRGHYGWSELRSLRSESFHFIEAPKPELYDLRADPAEMRNLAAERADAVAELRGRLDALREEFSAGRPEPSEPAEIDEETRAKLAALGYLGGPRRRVSPETEDAALADPKEKIQLHRLVKAAEADAASGRTEEALRSIERVLSEDSEIVEAYRIRGDLLRELREPSRAAESYRKALALDPEYKVAAFDLALLDLQMGRVDAAEAGFRRVLQIDRRDNKSWFLLARIHMGRRDYRKALETLDEAIQTTSDDAPFYTAKAECLLALDEVAAAETSIRQALELSPKVARAHHFLGVARERRGDVPGAIEAYEKEISLFPHDPETFLRLASLYRQRGDLASEISVLERAIPVAPRSGEAYVLLGRALVEARMPERARPLLLQGLSRGPSPEVDALGRKALAQIENHR